MQRRILFIVASFSLAAGCTQPSANAPRAPEAHALAAAVGAPQPSTGPALVLLIVVDSQRLEAFGITADEVYRVLQVYGPKIAPPVLSGATDLAPNPRFVLDASTVPNPSALGRIVIKFVNGSPIRLTDVANLETTSFPPGDLAK